MLVSVFRVKEPRWLSNLLATGVWSQRRPQLRRNGWLEAEFEGGDAYYVYGERIRDIAKRWGIPLSEPPEEVEQATA